MDFFFNFLSVPVILGIAIVVVAYKTIAIVPQNLALVVERLGKYHSTRSAGLTILIPFIDRVAARQDLREQAVDVPSQSAITKDNITLGVDGIVYYRIVDAEKATYGVEDFEFAVTQLAQTTMRSELGKLELDRTFEERDTLNIKIVESINQASAPWGIQLLRYEIKDITPPATVMQAMESQMKADREKRAQILYSEGERQSQINIAEGKRQAQILAAEAEKQEQILRAQGEAEALIAVARAQAESLVLVGEASSSAEGQSAVQLELATKAIEARHAIAKEGSVILLPDAATDIASVVAQAMAVTQKMNGA